MKGRRRGRERRGRKGRGRERWRRGRGERKGTIKFYGSDTRR